MLKHIYKVIFVTVSVRLQGIDLTQGENPLEVSMLDFIKRLSITLFIASLLAVVPFYNARSDNFECQKLGEYCGTTKSSIEIFGDCCDNDGISSDDKPPKKLKCKNLGDDDFGTCEHKDEEGSDGNSSGNSNMDSMGQ